MKHLLIASVLFLSAADVTAGCWLDGIEYPEGTVKGPMICGEDGYWRQS